MRYTIWGPVAGLVITSVLFLINVFGTNVNAYLMTGAALVIIGLVVGLIMDFKK